MIGVGENYIKNLKQINATWIENKIMGNNLSIKRKLRGRKMDRIYTGYVEIKGTQMMKQTADTFKFKVRTRKNTDEDINIQRHFPNWTENDAREAFFSLGKFAIRESERNSVSDFLGGKIEKNGIHSRFKFYMNEYPLDKGLRFIFDTLEYAAVTDEIAPEELLYELVEAVLAMTHPKSGKFSPCMEKMLNLYLGTVLNLGDIHGEADLFPTEGSNISVHYLIHSLLMNGVLERGDKVAFFVPKYSQEKIKTLFYKLEIDCIFVNYDVFEEGEPERIEQELQVLEDTKIKVLFMVGRSSRFVLEQNQVLNDKIDELLRETNPNLILVPDEMYAPFLKNYKSLYLSYPKNTIVLYSFSKYFGAPGWKLGMIMMSKDNVIDRIIEGSPPEKKAILNKRYQTKQDSSQELSFMERLIIESRLLSDIHLSGISTPQQAQMFLFAMKTLLDENQKYQRELNHLCIRRKKLFLKGLGVKETKREPSSYSAKIDVSEWIEYMYGSDIKNLICENYELSDIIYFLSDKKQEVFFGGELPEVKHWSIRLSMINLSDEEYSSFGRSLRKTMDSLVRDLRCSHYF